MNRIYCISDGIFILTNGKVGFYKVLMSTSGGQFYMVFGYQRI